MEHVLYVKGFLGGTSSEESAYQCRRFKKRRFNPWVGKIPWNRKWQHIPVFLSGKSMDKGTWQAIVHRVAKGRTGLSTRTYTHTLTHTHTHTHTVSGPVLSAEKVE